MYNKLVICNKLVVLAVSVRKQFLVCFTAKRQLKVTEVSSLAESFTLLAK